MNRGAQLFYRWRIDKDLTQRNVANMLDIDNSQLSKMELGHRKPGRQCAVRIEQITRGAVTCGSWDQDPLPQHVVDPELNENFDPFLDGKPAKTT